MAYDFNGTNQYFSTTSVPITALPFTMACFFNTDALDTRAQIYIGDTSGGSSRFLLNIRGANSRLAAISIDSSNTVASADTNIPTIGTWHHGCAIFESTTSRTAYIDGGNAVTNTTSNSPDFGTIDSIYIGAQNLAAPISFANGRIAEVGIWNAALTAAEIASLAKGMTCDKIRPQSLVFYAPLVRDLIDQKGGRVITNNNAAPVANHPRVYA